MSEKIKVEEVAYHRNGSAGIGFYVVRFTYGRQPNRRDMVGIVFPDRRAVAVLAVARLADGMIGGTSSTEDKHNAWDGPEFEHPLREAVLNYEQGRALSLPDAVEIRETRYGKHACVPHYHRDGGLILNVPDGECVICGKKVEEQRALDAIEEIVEGGGQGSMNLDAAIDHLSKTVDALGRSPLVHEAEALLRRLRGVMGEAIKRYTKRPEET